jgi:hypothetical protein
MLLGDDSASEEEAHQFYLDEVRSIKSMENDP